MIHRSRTTGTHPGTHLGTHLGTCLLGTLTLLAGCVGDPTGQSVQALTYCPEAVTPDDRGQPRNAAGQIRYCWPGEANCFCDPDHDCYALDGYVPCTPPAADAGTRDASTPDAGNRDASTPDAVTRDAGSPDVAARDAGSLDAVTRDVTTTDATTTDVARDAGTPDAGSRDTGTPDAGTPDTGTPDAGSVPGCSAPTPPVRVDPCPGRADCGLGTHGHVTVTGATATLREFQVRVVLPPAVRAATGPACDQLVFRAASGAWAPHWVQDCTAGVVWVRAPQVNPGGTTLAMHYGGASVPAAASYDDTFDRVPVTAAGLLGAWTFDEGAGTHTCPAAGSVAFDAYIHATPYAMSSGEVTARPALWSTDVPPSALAPAAHFARNNRSLDFPRVSVIDDPARPTVTHPGRLVNWQSGDSHSLRPTSQITVAAWVYAASPADTYDDNWQTVVSYGMPASPAPPYAGADVSNIGDYNPWGLFFRGDSLDDTHLFANTCAYPCLTDPAYAHIATRNGLDATALVHHWHFVAMTVNTTTAPHATRRAFYDGQVFEYQRDMVTWPDSTYCSANGSTCAYPPDGRLYYYDAPVLLGSDMNAGEPQVELEGRLDDLFILGRAASPAEIAAWRERRQYSADPLAASVTP